MPSSQSSALLKDAFTPLEPREFLDILKIAAKEQGLPFNLSVLCILEVAIDQYHLQAEGISPADRYLTLCPGYSLAIYVLGPGSLNTQCLPYTKYIPNQS